MEADLMDVKQLFSNMMRRVQPWILSHFIMWLDLKIAEYKVLGYMVLDKKSVYDKDLAQLYISSTKVGTPSPASATSSEHMYILPTQATSTTGDSTHSSKNPSPNVSKENKEYDNFAELVQHNKKKSVSAIGTFMPEKLNNSQICVNKNVLEKESGEDNSVSKEHDNCDGKQMENGLQNHRKQRKPGKVLHSIVNSLKQKTINSEPVIIQNGNHSEVKTDKTREVQTGNRLHGDKQTVSENSWYQMPSKVYNGKEQASFGPQEDRTVPYVKTSNKEMVESSEMEDDIPLYKSQQFSSLISLSRSRGRRRRSSNDEITYPLITVKDVDIPQMYDEEPRSQNLADFYFAQNQLDEQFAVRRARQNVCRTSTRIGNEKDGEETDTVFPETANHIVCPETANHSVFPETANHSGVRDKEMSLPLDKGQMSMIKRENVETSKDDDTSPDCSRIQNESLNNSHPQNQNHDNSNHGNIPQTVERSGDKTSDTAVFVKSEPQNDEEYYSANNGGQYDRLSNQSFSSEGDNSGYHDNSSHFEYQGDDITDESYILNNSELYGEDYIGSSQCPTGMDHHDNKMMRQRTYKKRPLSCNQNIVPRDPSSGKFVCELCGGTFTNRSSYFRHKRIHGEKKYRCFLCDKAFHRKEHLQSHVHRHTKSFPLKCGQCNYESHSLDEATTHFQTEHNRDLNQTP